MGVVANNDRQFTYIFSATSSIGEQGQGYAESIGNQVQILDISKTDLGNTIWVELAEKLDKDLKSLFSLEHGHFCSFPPKGKIRVSRTLVMPT